MRALVVRPGPGFSVADVATGWVEGLRGWGGATADFNLDDRLAFYAETGRPGPDGQFAAAFDEATAVALAAKGIEAACFEWWPDVVVVVSGFFVPVEVLDVIRARGIAVVLVHTESPYEDDVQLARAAHADLNVVNDPTHLDLYSALGPALYLAHAYRPTVHHPRAAKRGHASDFCFVGTGYPSRIRFFTEVDWSGLDVVFAGNWQGLDDGSVLRPFVAHPAEGCLDNTDAVGLYAGAKASANLYRREAQRPELSQGWAMGPREVELAACGTFYLTEARPENRQVLPMVPTFDGPGDFAEQLRWWLAHDDERAAVASAAREAIADRTFVANAARLMAELESRSVTNGS